jgi:hypothetical protein
MEIESNEAEALPYDPLKRGDFLLALTQAYCDDHKGCSAGVKRR